MSLNGIDISHHQGNMILSSISSDFVIIKASEGTGFRDPKMKNYLSQVGDKLHGLYHFANGQSTGKREAEFFLETIGGYVKDSFLVLDWEASALTKGVAYAKEFLDTVESNTGKTPYIYMSASVTREYDWASVAKTYPLWVAQYASMAVVSGYQSKPWTDGKGFGAWKKASIHQYTSRGRLVGFGGNLDLDIMYDKPDSGVPTSVTSTSAALKSDEEIVEEVIAGKWGTGNSRKSQLTKAGYDYAKIQTIVNEKVGKKKTNEQIANEVIKGLWGSGKEREQKLTAAGYDYKTIQNLVNKKMK